MSRSLITVAALTGLLAFITVSKPAAADEVVVAGSERVQTVGPNRYMLHTGIWTLGLSYVPSLIVAVESPVSSDKNLYIPVAGPWIDFANRDCRSCAHENFNKALLVTDGIFQGIGALEIVGSFLFMETRVHSASAESGRHTASFQIAPARLDGGAYGLAAAGSF